MLVVVSVHGGSCIVCSTVAMMSCKDMVKIGSNSGAGQILPPRQIIPMNCTPLSTHKSS